MKNVFFLCQPCIDVLFATFFLQVFCKRLSSELLLARLATDILYSTFAEFEVLDGRFLFLQKSAQYDA